MDHFAGLDVSVKETSLCIVDDAGRIVREVKVSEQLLTNALLAVLTNPAYCFKQIGLEAGPLSARNGCFSTLAEAGLPMICAGETRHMRAALKAQINESGPQRCAWHHARKMMRARLCARAPSAVWRTLVGRRSCGCC